MTSSSSSEPVPRHSLRQVADAAGVSAMTVSRAFRKHAAVRPDLRARILELAKEMGYSPDPRITSVMGALVRRTQPAYRESLAYIGYRHDDANVFMNRFQEGAVKRATNLGYHVDQIWLKEKGMIFSRLDRLLRTRNIRGLIIGPTINQAHGHIRLNWDNYAAVTVGSSLWKPRLNRVQHHHYMGMILTLRTVRQHRARKIGLVISALMNARSQGSYVASFLTNQSGAPGELLSRVFCYKQWNEGSFLAWLKKTKPDFIICSHLGAPQSMENYSAQYGFRSVYLDVSAETPQYAGIDQHYEVIGSHTVDLVLSELQHRAYGLPTHPKTVMIEGSWRDSENYPNSPTTPK
jgi:DNA-binding LacI/PurR family transcriptional regulator